MQTIERLLMGAVADGIAKSVMWILLLIAISVFTYLALMWVRRLLRSSFNAVKHAPAAAARAAVTATTATAAAAGNAAQDFSRAAAHAAMDKGAPLAKAAGEKALVVAKAAAEQGAPLAKELGIKAFGGAASLTQTAIKNAPAAAATAGVAAGEAVAGAKRLYSSFANGYQSVPPSSGDTVVSLPTLDAPNKSSKL